MNIYCTNISEHQYFVLFNRLYLGFQNDKGGYSEEYNYNTQGNNVIPELISCHGYFIQKFLWVSVERDVKYDVIEALARHN